MANALSKAGHQVHVLARQGTIPDALEKNISFYTFHFAASSSPLASLSRLSDSRVYWERGCSRALNALLRQIHGETPLDIVEIPEYNGLADQCTVHRSCTLIVNFHTPTCLIDTLNQTSMTRARKRWYAFERNALRNADGFRCPSTALARSVSTLYDIPLRDMTIIPNPCATETFNSIGKTEDTPKKTNDVLFSGRLERRKGAEILLETISGILEQEPSINFTIAGETEMGESAGYRQAIERSIPKKHRDRLWFVGPQTRVNLILLYCRSDIFLIPSLFENAPYALLEAMAARLPVIGTDTSGISEIIRHGENGLLFPPDRPTELFGCIREILNSSCARGALASNAYATVRERHDPDTIARQTIDFYESVRRRGRR
jgi:glycosyltransferase involved in cell wall biosynthesis